MRATRQEGDPRNLDRECETWDWVRTCGVSDEQLRDTLVHGPENAPRRRRGERPGFEENRR